MCEDTMSKTVETVDLPNINGEIRACTTPDAAPFSFFKNNKYEGYEVELLTEFCRRNGYALKIEGTSFDAFFPLIVTAIIYFIMAYFLTKIVDYLQQRFLANEKTKEEIL